MSTLTVILLNCSDHNSVKGDFFYETSPLLSEIMAQSSPFRKHIFK